MKRPKPTNDLPAPPLPVPGPSEYDDDFDASPTAWGTEIDWAKRGQPGPLVKSLRAGKAIGEEDGELYHFLADVIERRFRPPRGKPPKYEDWTFGLVGPRLPDDLCKVRKSYQRICQLAGFVWHHKAEARRRGLGAGEAFSEAIERAQREFRLTDKQQEKLETWLSRSTSERRRLAALK